MMTIYVNAEVFDHAVLHSSAKWTFQAVSSLVEELKMACPNRTVTKSKWLDLACSRLSISEANAYWSVFIATKGFILGQLGDWIDLQTLAILLLCQCFPNARARAGSFHRSEVLAQTLAATVVTTHSPANSPMNRASPNRNGLLNLAKLLRDNSVIMSFISDNLSFLVNLVALNLTPDDDFDVHAEQVDKLGVLLCAPGGNGSLSSHLLSRGTQSIKASALVPLLGTEITWNDTIFPQFDLTTPSQQILRTSETRGSDSLYILNHNRGTILRTYQDAPNTSNMYIVNCSDTSVYIGGSVRNVYIAGCIDCEIVLMAVTGSCVVNHSDKVIVRTVTASLRLENSTDSHAFVFTGRGVVLTGDTRGIVLAPFNVTSSTHESVLSAKTGIYPDSSHATLWAQPISATLNESPYMLLSPEKLRLISFPELVNTAHRKHVVCLPQVYADAVFRKQTQLQDLRNEILSISDESNVTKINSIIAGHFRDWITSHNRARTIVDIIKQAQSG